MKHTTLNSNNFCESSNHFQGDVSLIVLAVQMGLGGQWAFFKNLTSVA